MAKAFSLILSLPGSDPVQHRLTRDQVSLGRGGGNQIRVEAKAVSGRHCQFRRRPGGGYALVDLGSTNGTRVNGQRLMDPAGVALKHGDRLLFGETVPAQFIEAVEAREPTAPPGVAAWLAASAPGPPDDEELNPVAAAVARQEAARAAGFSGR